MKKTQPISIVLLLLTSMIWGSAFVAQSSAMDNVGPFTFLAVRNYIGSLVLLPLILYNRKKQTIQTDGKELWKGGVYAGMMLFFASGSQQIGIQYTTVGKAGFLTALYVLFVPFISLIFFHKKLNRKIWFCVGLAVVGMAMLCLQGSLRLQFGDSLELLCALLFSGHILVLDFYTEKTDPVKLSCVQFFLCGIIATFAMFLFEQPSISGILQAWLPICYAGIMSSGVGYTLQAVAQKKCDPTLASMVMCLESVFSAIFGWLILHQALSLREGIGCIFMFVAIVLANLFANQDS